MLECHVTVCKARVRFMSFWTTMTCIDAIRCIPQGTQYLGLCWYLIYTECHPCQYFLYHILATYLSDVHSLHLFGCKERFIFFKEIYGNRDSIMPFCMIFIILHHCIIKYMQFFNCNILILTCVTYFSAWYCLLVGFIRGKNMTFKFFYFIQLKLITNLSYSRRGRTCLLKFKFSVKFPIGLHVILQLHI